MSTSPDGRVPSGWTLSGLEPFGALLTAPSDRSELASVSVATLRALTHAHRVLLVRGCALRPAAELEAYCRSWGDLLRWPFGYVLELFAYENPENYLFTRGNVPFHWDGAFAAAEPSFLFFQCRAAPANGSGGESLFCDTGRVFRDAPETKRARWRATVVEYRTERVAHYGGVRRAPLVGKHPYTGETILRFAEPLNKESAPLNPIELEVLQCEDQQEFLMTFIPELYRRECCYAHAWREGDILVADNHALLHGRRHYADQAHRHLQRVHIL